MKSVSFASIALSIVLALAGIAHAGIKVGDRFVELEAKATNGKKFKLADMAGKWVVFTFGASWCGPCKKELVAWDKVAPKFAGKAIFVAVNINSNPDEGKEFITGLKLKHVFPVFMPVADDGDGGPMKDYNPDHMPSAFIIDPKGVVRHVHLGYAAGDEAKLAATLTDLTK